MSKNSRNCTKRYFPSLASYGRISRTARRHRNFLQYVIKSIPLDSRPKGLQQTLYTLIFLCLPILVSILTHRATGPFSYNPSFSSLVFLFTFSPLIVHSTCPECFHLFIDTFQIFPSINIRQFSLYVNFHFIITIVVNLERTNIHPLDGSKAPVVTVKREQNLKIFIMLNDGMSFCKTSSERVFTI